MRDGDILVGRGLCVFHVVPRSVHVRTAKVPYELSLGRLFTERLPFRRAELN